MCALLQCCPENGQQKTPTPSSARTKGRARQICHWRYIIEAPAHPHAAFRGTTSNTPDRYRSGALSSPTGATYTSDALNQGYAITGFPGLIYWPKLNAGRSSVIVLVGDLPRCGAGGTRSHATDICIEPASGSRDPALWAALWARTPPIEAGWRRPTVADTIASDGEMCQGVNGGPRTFHVKRAGFPLDSPYPCWYDRRNELLADHKNWRGGYPRQ